MDIAADFLHSAAMRTKIIVPAAGGVTLAAVIIWIAVALAAAPSLGAAASVVHRPPALALLAFALYALAALVLVTGMIIIDAARVRRRLAQYAAPTPRDWAAAFAETSLGPLAPRLLDLAPVGAQWPRARLILQSRFDAVAARREIGQFYSCSLVRAQFTTAFALCVAVAAAGFLQYAMRPAFLPAGIPAVPALTAVVVLALLGLLGRMVVGAAAEPLIETIEEMPAERLDLEVFGRLAGLAAGDEPRTAGSTPALSAAIGKLLERLIDALEESRTALVEAIADLSAQAEALNVTMRAAAEHETARSEERGPAEDLAEFRSAVAQLTAALKDLAGASRQGLPGLAAEDLPRKGEVSVIGPSHSQLSREVKDLLAGFE
ncbi:MAG TPA: hypothetical protein VJ770_08110 [Stellaceae bacterium]|nr:hypothetical protein [Stellaceae bacterium]